MEEPLINVGIMTAPEIEFRLLGGYYGPAGEVGEAPMTVRYAEGEVEWEGRRYGQLLFSPASPESSFELSGVAIGINFHWERRETQRFAGALKFIPGAGGSGCVAINAVGVEEYLKSVISSEIDRKSVV